MDTNNYRPTDTRRELFFAELHELFLAGLDFTHAFSLLHESETDRRMKILLQRLVADVGNGALLWQAMRRSGAFRALDCGVVRIGEQTGRLTEVLAFLADYYRKRSAHRKMLASAVSYPVVILCTAVAVGAFMLAVVVPMFQQVYARMGGDLPFLTRRIIALSESLPAATAGFVVFVAAVGALLYLNRDKPEVKAALGRMLLRLPLVGATIRKHHQARFCKLLCLLVSSGVPLLGAMTMLADAIGFQPYRSSFETICRSLEQGAPFASTLAKFPALYDRKLIALLRVGEETNRLAQMLRNRGEALTTELEYRIKRLGSLLEPLLVLAVGALVAVILIAMYLPMFRLGGIVA